MGFLEDLARPEIILRPANLVHNLEGTPHLPLHTRALCLHLQRDRVHRSLELHRVFPSTPPTPQEGCQTPISPKVVSQTVASPTVVIPTVGLGAQMAVMTTRWIMKPGRTQGM